jgi:hypothetical protein
LGVTRTVSRYLTHSALGLFALSLVVYAAGLYVYQHRTNVCGEWLGLYIAIGGFWAAAAGAAGLGASAYFKRSKLLGAGSVTAFLLAGLMYIVVGSIASACSGI